MSAPEKHPPSDAFAVYFRGLLDPADARALEEHVAACDVCAGRLRAEARVELALHEAHDGGAGAYPSERPHGRRRAGLVVGVALVAAAAAFLITRAPSRPRTSGRSASASATCTGSAPCGHDLGKESTMSKKAIITALLSLSPVAPVFACSGAPPSEAASVGAGNPAVQDFTPGPIPHGWILDGADPQSYAMGTDTGALHDGRAPLTLQSRRATESFGSVMTITDATPFRGKRVRLRGVARSEDVRGWGGLWMRVDGTSGRGLEFDNMHDRSVCGTTDWRSYDVVLDVPQEAAKIAFGVLLSGEGKLWADNLQLEAVDTSVPTTGVTQHRVFGPSGPGVESSWIIAGSEPAQYDMSADDQVRHGTGLSLTLRSKAPSDKGFGTLMQQVSASPYRGKRAHLAGFVRALDVTGWAGLWMRVDGKTPNTPLAFDNMEDRPIQGTIDWQKFDIALPVPAEAIDVAFGILLAGGGQVWLDDVSLTSE